MGTTSARVGGLSHAPVGRFGNRPAEIDDDTGRIGQRLTQRPRGIRRRDGDLADALRDGRRDARAAYQVVRGRRTRRRDTSA